ncbi:MAG TPA: PEP-CTERM sorting domain-containing protein [Steroidobacteraceae bacterium]|nr:PEP-CTERM sorting domain-containing protein [Steroidobacteraceae bacterium]
MTVSFAPDAAAVQGSQGGLYAAPYLSGGNGAGFGNPNGNQADGADATTYLTTGSTGAQANAAVTIQLPTEEMYFGLLWGSVDNYNTLSFYDGVTLVGQITGTDVIGSPNGDQGVNGTVYVNINSSLPFNKVVATSSQYAFEFDNLAFNPREVQVPEPGTLALLALGLAGLGASRRRKAD